MKTQRRVPRNARGQVLVIYTIALVALLGAVALCTDVAVLYFNWGQLQKAADAAAVAGAHYLPNQAGQGGEAYNTAFAYAAKNGVPSSQVVSVTFGANNTQITVKLQRSVNLIFARVLNFLNAPVTVQATAEIQPAGGVGGILPIGLACTSTDVSTCGTCTQDTSLQYQTTDGQMQSVWNCTLKYGQIAPGNWEPLALGANGANSYRNSLANGYPGTFQINSDIPVSTEPGNMMGPTLQGLGIRLGKSSYPTGGGSVGGTNQPPPLDSTGSLTTTGASDSRLVLVPMVNYTGAQGKTTVPIMSFALAWIGQVNRDGSLNIYFLAGAQDPYPVTPNNGGANTGPYGVALIN